MKNSSWDIVIVGGGLGGLSLAVELAQPAFSHLRVLVLEKRTQYERDRTWSYWATHAHRYTGLERKRWKKWAVRFEGRHAVQKSSIPYCTIDADAFYDFAQIQIACARHVQLQMGAEVSEIVDAAMPEVQLADGSRISAQWVLDARPPGTPLPQALCQRFMGWELHTEEDCFDADVVELMDFQPSPDGLHFFYVLPYGPRHALVESTWFSTFARHHDYESELLSYLQERYGVAQYRQIYREQGCLNLQMPSPASAGGRVVPLGRTAGTLRSSTGFAFLETIADAERIARRLALGSSKVADIEPFRRSPLDLWMDQVFFEALSADWKLAPEYFMALFEGLDAETLVAFLSGRPAFAQRVKVAMQLPTLDFLRAAGRRALRAEA